MIPFLFIMGSNPSSLSEFPEKENYLQNSEKKGYKTLKYLKLAPFDI
jgi:hypothetical protein